jgi:hypothetical protein
VLDEVQQRDGAAVGVLARSPQIHPGVRHLSVSTSVLSMVTRP